MPRQKNPLLRAVVTIVVVVIGIGVVAAVFVQSGRQTRKSAPAGQSASAPNGPGVAPGQQASDASQAPDVIAGTNGQSPVAPSLPAADEPSQPSAGPAPGGGADGAPSAAPGSAPPAGARRLRARVFADAPIALTPIGGVSADGSVDPQSQYEVHLAFTPFGAGIDALTLTKHYKTIRRAPDEHYVVQSRQVYTAANGTRYSVAAMAAREIEIDGSSVNLYSDTSSGTPLPVWRETGPGRFEAVVEDAEGRESARIEKRYTVRPGAFDITLEQTITNLSGAPMTARLLQFGSVDLPMGDVGYGGDKRRVRFGFLLGPRQDPSRQLVNTDEQLRARDSIIKSATQSPTGNDVKLWPDDQAIRQGRELVWAAMTNRYFTFASHPLVDMVAAAAGQPIEKRFKEAEEVYAHVLGASADGVLSLRLHGPARVIGPGESASVSVAAYGGPLGKRMIATDPAHEALGLEGLIVYNFGGPCAWCTFPWLTTLLHWFLSTLHDYIVHDWSLAIMVLVVCVRAILHPVTRRSQIGLQRFSKQMQAIAPKQQKVRERFKDDPKKMQQEMMRLYREENVKFTGALGCLPMFLQSPIWIALYAMLFFAFELRHEPAFFGLFQWLSQSLTGQRWSFLADLSAPDHFIWFGRTVVTIPLLGPIEGINVLPLVLGVVFFVQQKYLTPPPSAAMTPEQQQQQKIMKVMMVVMFPLLMYNAPSGLAIYFITNSVLGILESRHIRAHIDKMDLLPKPAGPGAGGGPGKKKVFNTSPFQKKRGPGKSG